MSILTLILGLPLVGAVAVGLTPRQYRFGIRLIALSSTFIAMCLAIVAFCRFPSGGGAGFLFEQRVPWVNALGISYHVGADGLNIGIILMGAIVAFAAA